MYCSKENPAIQLTEELDLASDSDTWVTYDGIQLSTSSQGSLLLDSETHQLIGIHVESDFQKK
jgi:hypothetical protein